MTDEELEYESVSRQSDEIVLYAEKRFKKLMKKDRIEDAIAIGDEFLEWISQDPDEVFLYFNEHELKADYESRA